MTDMLFAAVCLSLYFLCVKANAWKLLFLCFFIFNYMVTLRGICFRRSGMLSEGRICEADA